MRLTLGGGGEQTLGELQELVEPGYAWNNEWVRVKHHAVADARGVGVGDEAVIRPIVR